MTPLARIHPSRRANASRGVYVFRNTQCFQRRKRKMPVGPTHVRTTQGSMKTSEKGRAILRSIQVPMTTQYAVNPDEANSSFFGVICFISLAAHRTCLGTSRTQLPAPAAPGPIAAAATGRGYRKLCVSAPRRENRISPPLIISAAPPRARARGRGRSCGGRCRACRGRRARSHRAPGFAPGG